MFLIAKATLEACQVFFERGCPQSPLKGRRPPPMVVADLFWPCIERSEKYQKPFGMALCIVLYVSKIFGYLFIALILKYIQTLPTDKKVVPKNI